MLRLLLDSISGKPFNIPEQLLFRLALASLVHARIKSLSVCNIKIHFILAKVIHVGLIKDCLSPMMSWVQLQK